MITMKKSELIKSNIMDLVKEYYIIKEEEKLPSDKIQYAGLVYDHKELINAVSSVLDFRLTHDKYCDEFENLFSNLIDSKHSIFVNSGSSANLLAFMCLTSPLLKDRQICRGDEIITTPSCFPTTVSPIVNYGAIPVFVDIDINTLNIDLSKLEKSLSNKTKAVMIAHTLGNPFNIERVREFCDEYGLWLVSDECDALCAKYNGLDLNKYSDVSTFSFFPAHHFSVGEGGMVCTNNDLLKKIILSMRDWGRDCSCSVGQDNKCGKRFTGVHGLLPYGYDHKYVYSNFGYNLKATEMQAAIGLAQLEKITDFIDKRNSNWDRLYNGLLELSDCFIFQHKENDSAQPSWFAFTLTLKDNVKFNRSDIVNLLEANNIQTRCIFAGNILLHPCSTNLQNGKDYRVVDSLTNSDKVTSDSFFVGVYPKLQKKHIDYMILKIKEFVFERQYGI